MSYHIYMVDGPYISGKKHDVIVNAMQTLSKYLNELYADKVNRVCVVKTDSLFSDKVLFSTEQVRYKNAIFHKVYSGPMTNNKESIYVSGHSKGSVTKSILDGLLRDEITLSRIEAYDFSTGEFIMARQKTYNINGEAYRDVSLEEILG